MRCMFVVALALAVTAAGLTAQSYPGDIISITSSGNLYRTPQDGSAATTLAVMPGTGTSYGLALSFDNSTLLVTRAATNGGAIISYDSKSLAVTTMFQSSLYAPREVLVNQEGNPVFTAQMVGSSTTQYGLFEMMPGGAVRTITKGPLPLDAGLEVNMSTGNYLMGAGSFQYGLYDVASDGTVLTLSTAVYNRYSITQDYATGDIYGSSFSRPVVLKGGTANGTVQTLTPLKTSYYYAFAMDRASDTQSVLWSRYSTSIYRFAPSSNKVANTICPSTIGTHYEMVFDGQRNLASALTAVGKWDIYINFPGEAGLPYAIGLSTVGYRPPITLPDGRRICLRPDLLTQLSFQGLLAPVFNPGSGQLDTSGRAVAKLNVQNLPKTGIPVWFVALTVTGGKIQTISDPYVIKLP